MVLAELIGASIIILSIVYIYYKYVIYNFWHKKGVFYIKPIVPIGNILPLVTGKTQVGVFFQDAYQKYKEHRCFGMYAFFKPNLVITDLDLMRTVLTKEFKSFHDRGLYSNETIDPAINRLFLNGQNWLHYRAKMTPTFTAGKMKQMFVIVKQCGEELAKHLEKNAQMRDTVEMRDILTRYASDSIMSAAFGVNTNCIQKPNEYQSTSQEKTTFDSNFFKRILIRFAPQVTDFFSLPFSVQAVTNFYMNLFRDTVEYRKANGIVRPDLMSLLIEHVEKDFDPKGDKKPPYNVNIHNTYIFKLITLPS